MDPFKDFLENEPDFQHRFKKQIIKIFSRRRNFYGHVRHL